MGSSRILAVEQLAKLLVMPPEYIHTYIYIYISVCVCCEEAFTTPVPEKSEGLPTASHLRDRLASIYPYSRKLMII